MNDLADLVMGLPGLQLLEDSSGVTSHFWLSTGGFAAFGGALRFFPHGQSSELPSLDDWNSPYGWLSHYGHLAPSWLSIGEDAFGTQFLLCPDASEVALFWAETAEVERIGATPAQFISMLVADPANTISLPVYDDCVGRFGRLALRQHFALRVETAAGGRVSADNVMVMDAVDHMNALGRIALQLGDVLLGTRLTPVR